MKVVTVLLTVAALIAIQPALLNAGTLELSYSTYLGGSNNEYVYGITLGTGGEVYVTGITVSINFPTWNPYQASSNGSGDAFVSRFSSSGSSLIYSTYLGGSSGEGGQGIALGAGGEVYVAGSTGSVDFPTLNPYQASFNSGTSDVFVSKISTSGSSLIYSTYLGGSDNDQGYGIALRTGGEAYIVGEAISRDFPTSNPYQASHAGGTWDVFVSRLSTSGSSLIYSTYLGGSNVDDGLGITVGPGGEAYVVGGTGSSDFPTRNPYQASYGGIYNVFVSRLSTSGSSLIYSTYLGGSGGDAGHEITLGTGGEAYVVGNVDSWDFPTVNSYQASYGGNYDAFVSRLSTSGSLLIYSTYFGGSSWDEGYGIDVDTGGEAHITGNTQSTDFPTLNSYQSSRNGYSNAFVSRLSNSGSSLVYSTYLGGTVGENGYGIILGTGGEDYVTGWTYSTDFPILNPYQASYGGGTLDIFVSKLIFITPTPTPSPSPSPSPTIIQCFDVSGQVTDKSTGLPITGIQVQAFVTGDYSSSVGTGDTGGLFTVAPCTHYTNGTVRTEAHKRGYLPFFSVSSYTNWSEVTGISIELIPSLFPQGVVSSDYDGNGTSDTAVFQLPERIWAVRNVTRIYFGGENDELVPADYDGDGTTNACIFRPANGYWAIYNLTRYYFGSIGAIPVPGDYDNDGTDELAVVRAWDSLWSVRGFTRFYLGSTYDQPVPRDFNGDGVPDAGMYRRTGGMWAIRNITRVYFGSSDDLVPGDYNGAGFWEAGIFRESTSLWSIRNVTRLYLGSTNDWAVPADYNQDGTDEAGIFRNSNGLWSVVNTTRVYFGGPDDIPVTR